MKLPEPTHWPSRSSSDNGASARSTSNEPLQQRFEQGLQAAQRRVQDTGQGRNGDGGNGRSGNGNRDSHASERPSSSRDPLAKARDAHTARQPNADAAEAPAEGEVDAQADAHASLARLNGRGGQRGSRHQQDEEGATGDDAAGWQALLTAARMQPMPDALMASAAASANLPPAPQMTPQDLAHTVTAAWLHEPPTTLQADAASTQWTFAMGDALTPLAELRIRGDANAGWSLHLTPSRGMNPQALVNSANRLRARLQARGQRVEGLFVDDEEDAAS